MKLEFNVQEDFDFLKILQGKPFYFFYSPEPSRVVFINGKPAKLGFSQKDGKLTVNVDRKLSKEEEKIVKERVAFCLGVNENMGRFYELCRQDIVLNKLLPRIKGTRMVSAFSDFEALVGAIVSQNNSFRNYLQTMQKLCAELNFVPENYLDQEKLRKLKLGYKAPFIVGLAKIFLSGAIPRELTKIKGVGKYSAALFNIFQRRDFSGFYWDTLTERILREHYKVRADNKSGKEEAKKLWGEYSGLAEILLQKFLNDTVAV
ncbi:MAG: hypothetical protein HY362_01635 [Candidatus Aenigmarchaeota archaeon]|nr:hypothetical protein [Candidatus Aenigmarchaeota archaeon]